MAAIVRATQLSEQSLLHQIIQPGDFLDCYSVRSTMSPRNAAQVISQVPGWARGLMNIRRLITAPFGLLQDGPDNGDKIGFFPVDRETETEVIAGFNDRHLDFRVSVLSENGTVSLATWVHPHNLGGRIYLRLILPFHVAISRNALARVARAG